MPNLQKYLEYVDPNVTIWRNGSPSDPFKPRSDSLPVINNKVTLLEIPVEIERVQVSGFTEISLEVLRKKNFIAENEFIVDYATGIVEFNSVHEAKTFVFNYSGRGLTLIPASRVYALVQKHPDIVVTLQDYVNELNIAMQQLNEKISETNTAIENAINATNNANQAADNAAIATEAANEATQTALDASDSTIMVYQNPVATYDDITTTYPTPENGWRVMTSTDGNIYRYDGVYTGTWVLVENWTGGSIPLVSETVDGLLASEDYTRFQVRTMIFYFYSLTTFGVQHQIGRFPFDGVIESVSAFCSLPSGTTIEVSLEKESIENQNTWNSIFTQDIVFAPSETNGTQPEINDAIVKANDRFRVYTSASDSEIRGLTIQVNIRI